MRKTLLVLLSLGLFGWGANAYSQSSKEEIPEAVKNKAAEYLKWVPYCPGDPIIEKIGEKIEDRTINLSDISESKKEKDGIKDKAILYLIKNKCSYGNVPNYMLCTQIGLKEGEFSKEYIINGLISRDEKGESIPLKEDW